jgi:hypothetical protein
MKNPYSEKPNASFWRRAVPNITPDQFDPVLSAPFTFSPTDRIATAGSCFAQHIAKTLVKEGFCYFVTEHGPADKSYGVFPARFGNIYSSLQLLQLFQRAYGLYEPQDQVWRREDSFVDPFRPLIEAFASAEALLENQAIHLCAVRKMFEECDVFIFTLGLTEIWTAASDEAVVPLAPGVSNTLSGAEYKFSNRSVPEMINDMERFIAALRVVNPKVKIVLTVSPVPLIATFEPRHVLVSTVYSKAALRVVAETVTTRCENVAYFPSYEIITGLHVGNFYFENDLREVRAEGVSHVMSLFKKYYLSNSPKNIGQDYCPDKTEECMSEQKSTLTQEMIEAHTIICDEEAIDD